MTKRYEATQIQVTVRIDIIVPDDCYMRVNQTGSRSGYQLELIASTDTHEQSLKQISALRQQLAAAIAEDE